MNFAESRYHDLVDVQPDPQRTCNPVLLSTEDDSDLALNTRQADRHEEERAFESYSENTHSFLSQRIIALRYSPDYTHDIDAPEEIAFGIIKNPLKNE